MLEKMINESYVKFNIDALNKDDALKKIAKIAMDLGITTSDSAYYKGLVEREEESTTGFGYGIAIPHGRVDEVTKFSLMCFTFKDPIDWNSMDGKKVKLVLVIAVPNSDVENTHLKVLASLARKIMHEDFREELLTANTEKQIVEILTNKEEGEML